MKQFLDVEEMSSVSGLSPKHIRQLIKEGTIPYIMSGNKVLINYELASAALDDLSLKAVKNE